MKKTSILLFVLINLIFRSYSQQAYYGFYDKFYTGILGNGEYTNSHMYDNSYNLNLWMHYNHYRESANYDKGWTEWVGN